MPEVKYPKDVFGYIISEESKYQSTPITVMDGYDWSMYEHVKRSFLYKNSKFWKGADDGNRPFKNITKPILNVAYRSEGFDVKDIVPYVNDSENYYKSFLVKKFHPRWARQNDIDTFIDELVESYCDYGLALVKNVNDVRPEVVPLQRLAFCDQTDILSGPICEKHNYSADQLQEMAGKWDADKIEELITLSTFDKSVGQGEVSQTPGKYCEVYELHGNFPESWLDEEGSSNKFVPQIHIVSYYKTEKGKEGITLFKGPEKKSIYKALKRDPLYGRACGFGGVEELFEPQTWTNYSEIQLKEMLDQAAIMILQTTDKGFANRNKTIGTLKGQIVSTAQGETPLSQVAIQPYNKAAFDNTVAEWENHAMTMGSATEGSLGKNPSAGTPFALQNLIVQEGKGLHYYRRGKIATFVSEIYRDWVLEYLVKEMNRGDEWMDELDLDEMQWVAEQMVNCYANDYIIKALPDLLSGDLTGQIIDMAKEQLRDVFLSSGNKKFIEIAKDELRDIPIDVYVNVAGKQKDLFERTDKLVNIFRTIISAPQMLQDKGIAKLFNQIIESSGLDPVDFSGLTKVLPAPMEQSPTGGATPAVATEPLNQLTNNQPQ